jgi:hypothetical protein
LTTFVAILAIAAFFECSAYPLACPPPPKPAAGDGVQDETLEARRDADRLQTSRPDWPVSLAFTMDPRMATPKTAPISRLVLVADAAMPERSGGTTVSGVEVTGTSMMPNPMPAMGRTQPRVEKVDVGPEHDCW